MAKYKDREWLETKYHTEGKSTPEIADICNVSSTTISYWMDKFDIQVGPSEDSKKKYQDKSWLVEQYWGNERSMGDMADELGIERSILPYWMDKYDIDRREGSVEAGKAVKKSMVPDELLSESWLRDKYVKQNMTLAEISDLVDRAPHAVHRALKNHGIERRSQGPRFGEDSPFWKGGGRFYYGSNWHKRREEAIERDGSECRVCGMSRQEHRDSCGGDLHVHHITPRREFDTPEEANSVENLITLCVKHHHKWEGIPVVPEMVDDD